MAKPTLSLLDFPVSSTPQLRQKLLLGEEYEQLLRERLPTPLYWWQPERLVFWNERLVIHYVHSGFRSDTAEHQRLVEQYQLWLKRLAG